MTDVAAAGSELMRLRGDPAAGGSPGGAGLVTVRARVPPPADGAQDEAWAVLRRVNDVVLAAVLLPAEEHAAPDADRHLPPWFRQACAPEGARSPDERRWTARSWLSWFDPSDRPWRWWDAEVVTPDLVRVRVEVPGWPVALGALAWALEAAGAVDVTEDESSG
ncbi:hypothetical protein ENKNEFLB_00459 [Nocardioides aquaticus]|uniref:Uncharacterized protein n=1 Tax=Nocardioides aquaticus TaxID=160826 RepID=A0ABX8ECC8_9ACTN|nr:hypothetical protein [Nocardioides aquaticus]QVT78087.1 hypothetical protein ENKNEFLB_00459 [Nocardioides aquaticus]